MKMVIGSYISTISLNVNGLNAPNKKKEEKNKCTKQKTQAGWVDENTCARMHFHLPHPST